MHITHTKFTADPAPVVFNDLRYSDTLYVYTTNDAPGSDWFTMDNLLCYSTNDMVNWTDHGAVMTSSDFSWAKKNTLWASQVIDRNGRFYAYVPIEREGSGPQIGVGISDSPHGPFKDALGKPLITATWDGDIDPTVFIDDDGQAYMYWGNPQLKYVKLKENMVELDGPVTHVPMTEESFGKRDGGPSEDGKYPTAYEEGPWLYKRDIPGLKNPYYLIFAGGQLPEHIGYSTAPTAEGPWEYGGVIMPSQEGTAFTIHPGVVDYKGRSYFFYHDQMLTELIGFTGGFTRSVSVEEFTYNPDGSIPEIPMTVNGPSAIEIFDFIDNRVFDDCYGAFASQPRQSFPGGDIFSPVFIDTGVKVHKNGDVDFKIYAPVARSVKLVFGIRAHQPENMEKGGDGVWRYNLRYSRTFCGPKVFFFEVDGMSVLSPYCPQYFSHGMAVNYVDIPDKNTPYILMRNVPHGSVTNEFYWSNYFETWQRCLVYTPPGYESGSVYPVLYLQHGGGENETSWVYNGRVTHIMDNLIAEKTIEPFVIVMNSGMVRRKDEEAFSYGEAFTKTLINDCIPFIEKGYSVNTDKWSRAIAGFSMGSMQSSIIGLTHPEIFSHIGLLSGFMRRLGPEVDSDSTLITNPHLALMDNRERFISEIKLFYRGIGSDDLHINTFYADDTLCEQRGYNDYPNIVRLVVEDYPHDWSVLRILFHDFAQKIFR